MEDFVPYELAVKLREKGFREKCYKHYYPNSKDWFISSSPECDNYSSYLDAPTISQVLKWLREEKNIVIMIDLWLAGYSAQIYIEISEWNDGFDWKDYYNDFDCCKTYELAALAGIEYVLDNNLI